VKISPSHIRACLEQCSPFRVTMRLVITIEYLLLPFAVASTSPVSSNQTQEQNLDQFVGYVSDPNGRGTASLVISCILTLVLCVWSALHLNVPRSNTTTLQWLWLNVRWFIVGIYCPELVVFAAWRQWSSACLLQRYIEQMEAV
jgi:hypothetical protein